VHERGATSAVPLGQFELPCAGLEPIDESGRTTVAESVGDTGRCLTRLRRLRQARFVRLILFGDPREHVFELLKEISPVRIVAEWLYQQENGP